MEGKWAGLEAIILVCLIALGAGVWYDHTHPRTTVVTVPSEPTIKVVTVDGPVTTKVVTQTITDPQQAKLVEGLIEENKKLREQVTTLTSTVATLQTQGGTNAGGTVTPVVPNVPGDYRFKDDQLDATYRGDGSRFNYTLTQSLTVVTSTGKKSDGSKLSIVELFNNRPGGPIKIPVTTTELQLPDNPPHFTFSPRVQGGLGWATDGRSGLVALQWLRRGTSPAAEDTKWSLLSPAIGTNGLTLLPFSINLGQIKHNPLTNFWASPTINSKAVGIALTATF